LRFFIRKAGYGNPGIINMIMQEVKSEGTSQSSQETEEYVDQLLASIDRLIKEHDNVCQQYQLRIQQLEAALAAATSVASPVASPVVPSVTPATPDPLSAESSIDSTAESITQNAPSAPDGPTSHETSPSSSTPSPTLSSDTPEQAAPEHEEQPTQTQQHNKPESKPKPRSKPRSSFIGSALFYGGLLVFLVLVFSIYGGGTGAPRSVLGYSVVRVLTASMQEELPKDSLVVTQEVDPTTLKVGDDITFLKDPNTTVTHRIVSIQESYAHTGERGFETQGIMNATPDKEIVAAQNVVGKVVFHNLLMGQIVGFIREHVLWIAFFAALGIALVACLRIVFTKEEVGEEKGAEPA
jgi:signal peptidase